MTSVGIGQILTDTMWLIEEELAIAERSLGVLVYRHLNRLNVKVAPTLAGREPPDFVKSLDEWGRLLHV